MARLRKFMGVITRQHSVVKRQSVSIFAPVLALTVFSSVWPIDGWARELRVSDPRTAVSLVSPYL